MYFFYFDILYLNESIDIFIFEKFSAGSSLEKKHT